jgi:hypothetical protein
MNGMLNLECTTVFEFMMKQESSNGFSIKGLRFLNPCRNEKGQFIFIK